jgi:hypothetical protein
MSSGFQWAEFWRHGPAFLTILFIFGGGIVIAIISLICNAWKSNRQNERLAILKQQMLDKGMSADEIVRVINAGQEGAGEAE